MVDETISLNASLSRAQCSFNCHQSRSHILTEKAFGRLKAKWCQLYKCNDMNINKVPCIVFACCILQNICELHNNSFNESWLY